MFERSEKLNGSFRKIKHPKTKKSATIALSDLNFGISPSPETFA